MKWIINIILKHTGACVFVSAVSIFKHGLYIYEVTHFLFEHGIGTSVK